MTVPSPEKQSALLAEMKALNIKETDIAETFILGSGKGGQKQNKSHTCVQLRHIPTGIIIKCQKSRERELNRFFARRQLCEQLTHQDPMKQSQKEVTIANKIKQKKRRKRRSSSQLKTRN